MGAFNKKALLAVKNYREIIESFLIKQFSLTSIEITSAIELDPAPENSKYEALTFALNGKAAVYRKGNITKDRPGAFLSLWQRPVHGVNKGSKPIPLAEGQVDYLFIQVNQQAKGNSPERKGMFIFPNALLVDKGIVSSSRHKGKTGFRVFPPWSEDRGKTGTKVFSASGMKTQRWQIPYFLEIDELGLMDVDKIKKIIHI